ncbi:MAG: helix-turn-helix transcriptional regulator [Sandaracinaceae bacterium]|nr:helix-turn-helix transcriptional regulator [Sandaracinaceae bacterium]
MTTATTHEADGRTVRAKQKRARRRQTILDAALRVFSAKGYHQTRIADIIEEASIARGTFYLYFDSKTAIFHELLEDVLTRIDENVAGVDLEPGALPVREQLLNTVRKIFSVFRADRAFAKLILREAVGLDEEVDAMLDGFYGRLHRWLSDSLRNGQRIGLIRAGDTELTAWLILGSVKQFAALVLTTSDEDIDLEQLSEVILDFNLQGIRAF